MNASLRRSAWLPPARGLHPWPPRSWCAWLGLVPPSASGSGSLLTLCRFTDFILQAFRQQWAWPDCWILAAPLVLWERKVGHNLSHKGPGHTSERLLEVPSVLSIAWEGTRQLPLATTANPFTTR